MTEVIFDNYDIYNTPTTKFIEDESGGRNMTSLTKFIEDKSGRKRLWSRDYVPPIFSGHGKVITRHKKLNLPPSRFIYGCVCGHNIETRDLIYDHRKRNLRCPGITIRPRVEPISIRFRS